MKVNTQIQNTKAFDVVTTQNSELARLLLSVLVWPVIGAGELPGLQVVVVVGVFSPLEFPGLQVVVVWGGIQPPWAPWTAGGSGGGGGGIQFQPPWALENQTAFLTWQTSFNSSYHDSSNYYTKFMTARTSRCQLLGIWIMIGYRTHGQHWLYQSLFTINMQ